LLSAQEDESGSIPSEGVVQHFSLRSRAPKPSEPATHPKAVSVLVVEDNPADVGLVREALEEHGVEGELLVLKDGEEAIRMIQEIESERMNCPDLFIIDLNLPKKPGREVLEQVRQGLICRRTPVVALSSSDSQQDQDDASRLGVSRYMRKPSRLEEFISLGAIFKEMILKSAE
jgi:CheY-like chemotaxis protein